MDPTVKETFYNDIYSNHFNQLRYLGQWNLDTDDPLKKNLYSVYKVFILIYGTSISAVGIIDLYQSLNDFEKIFFNLCTTILTTGILLKNTIIQLRSDKLNKLRLALFQDSWEQKNNPDDVAIRARYTKILVYHKKTFYFAAFTVLPIWLATSLLSLKWGPREMPFQVWMPIDLEDDVQYVCGFIYQTIASVFIVAETIHADLAFFSLLLQIASQYNILAKNVSEIDKVYIGRFLQGNHSAKYMNKTLLNHQTKELLKKCIKRQLILSRYVKEVEDLYNKTMMIQLIVGFVLSIGNGLELMLSSMNVSVKVSYQIGYTLIVLGDVFMCCNLSDLLMAQARRVEWSLYDIAWFDMDSEIRRYLLLLMLGAQKIQPLTAAKLFGLNLTSFLGLLKNVYSWLALFRQLVIKD